MVYLGLDYGERRIGTARSDEMGVVAEPMGFIGGGRHDTIAQKILDVVNEVRAERVVVGLPRTTRNEIGDQAKKVLEFVEVLKRKVPCEIITWDERMTSQAADHALREMEVTPSRRRYKRDSIAAQMMLQSYLDFLRVEGNHVSAQ